MPIKDEKEQHSRLLELVRTAIQQDEALREKYSMGNKFRFVRDKLTDLFNSFESQIKEKNSVEKKVLRQVTAASDEIIVYVHIFNARGAQVKNWQSMLNPKLFYDYGVNRPIYTEKKFIDAFLRGKGLTEKLQSAYLTIAIKKSNLIGPTAEKSLSDSLGNPLVKVAEGALAFEKLIAFTHNDQDYVVTENIELIKK